VSVARERANAWLDGEVVRERGSYAIKLRVFAGDKELGSAEGRAPILFDAVAQALDGLVASGALPRSRELEPRVARIVGTSTVKAGLIASTWQTRSDPEDPISSSCIQLRDDLPGAGLLGRTIGIVCARRLGWERPESVELDRSSPFALGYTAVMKLLLEEGWDPAPVAQELEAARRKEADPQARAWLADTEIALWEIAKRPDRAVRVARELIDEFPRVASFRHATAVYAESSSLRTVGLKAHAAWLPYDARNAWSKAWMLDEDLPLQLSWTRRAFELDSANATYAVELAESLFMADRASEVPSIAARFEASERHADLVDYLGARVEAEAGRPSAGLDRLLRRLRETPNVGRTTDHHVMLTALHLAEMLGRGREFADFFVNRFVLADPPRLVAPPPLRNQAGLIGLCMRASDPIARPCLERVRSHFKMRWSPDDEQYWQGAMRYVAGDCTGAVDRWRPLLTRSASHLRDAPVEAFDRAGEPELASRLDAVSIKQRRNAIRGVNLAWVREARRAAKRGDVATARKLANQVVGAWEVLDTRLSVVDEMRTLAGR